MKRLIIFALFCILAGTAFGQYPANPNKIRLGNQTSGDGLVYRGSGAPAYTPSGANNAWVYIDSVAGRMYTYRGGAWELVSAGAGVDSTAFRNDTLFIYSPDTTFYEVISAGIGIEDVREEIYDSLSVFDTIPTGVLSIGKSTEVNNTSVSLFLRRFSSPQKAQVHFYQPSANNPKLQICNGCTFTGELAGIVLNDNQPPISIIFNNSTLNPDVEISYFNRDVAGQTFTSANKIQLAKFKSGNGFPSVSIGNYDPLTGTKLRVKSDAATSAASIFLAENSVDTVFHARNDGLIRSKYYGSSSTFTAGATSFAGLDANGNQVRVQALFPGTNTSITADSILTSAVFGAELTIDDTTDNSDYTTATLPTPTQDGVLIYVACIGTVTDGDDGCVIQRAGSTTIGLGGATSYTLSAGETKIFRFNSTANRWTIY